MARKIMAGKTSYGVEDILKAKRAMLHHLASLSGGELIAGCGTQGCLAEPTVDYKVVPGLTVPLYSSQDMLDAKRAMLSALAEISGGKLILGCCTQGCCDDDAMAALINIP
jgi:hypothetical protein